MENPDIIKAIIRDKNTITVPKKLRDLLNANEGDILVFKKDGDHITVGVTKRKIKEKTTFTVETL